MVIQNHLGLILYERFKNINVSLDNIEATTNANIDQLYGMEMELEGKNTQKFGVIKPYLIKQFSRLNAESHKTCLHYMASFLILKDASGQQATSNIIIDKCRET